MLSLFVAAARFNIATNEPRSSACQSAKLRASATLGLGLERSPCSLALRPFPHPILFNSLVKSISFHSPALFGLLDLLLLLLEEEAGVEEEEEEEAVSSVALRFSYSSKSWIFCLHWKMMTISGPTSTRS